MKTWTKGKYTISRELKPFGRTQWRIDNGWQSDYPILYDNGQIAYDNPEWWPPYIRRWLEAKMRKEVRKWHTMK